MSKEKRYNIYWTKVYDDSSIIEHKSVKNWPLERAMYLTSVGEKLTGKPHVIREVDDSVPFRRVIKDV
jgi:hypothetical protein